MKRFILLAAGALALTACGDKIGNVSNASDPVSNVSTTVDTVILDGQRGFAAAEIVYTDVAKTVEDQVDHGRIKGALATRFRDINKKAGIALTLGHAATTAAEKARQAAVLFGLVDDLNLLKGSAQ